MREKEELFLTVESQVQNIEGMMEFFFKSPFGNHYSSHWLGQESLMDIKSSG